MGCGDSKPDLPAKHERELKTKQERSTSWPLIRARLPRTRTEEDKNRRLALWRQIDQNSSGRVSLVELDVASRTILHLDDYTSRLSALLFRAFNKANSLDKERGSLDFVEFKEFRLLLCYIYDYFELNVMFDEVDSSDDGRVSRDEFKKALPLIEKWGLKLDDADATFQEIDTDNGGMILFTEFAEWATAKKLDADGDPDNDR